jgi:hypothetical protein
VMVSHDDRLAAGFDRRFTMPAAEEGESASEEGMRGWA